MLSLFLKKMGMLQMFRDDGTRVAVTILQKTVCRIISERTLDKDGYTALVVGVGDAPRSLPKPQKGVYAKANLPGSRYLKEIRVTPEESARFKQGDDVSVDVFSAGEVVDVVGVSKGRGFSGVMRRHNFAGLCASHGVSVSHRSHGSTGQHTDPARVFKGKKMAGQYGNKRVTVQNLKVYSIDLEKNLVFVEGSVPGSRNQYVRLQKAVKA